MSSFCSKPLLDVFPKGLNWSKLQVAGGIVTVRLRGPFILYSSFWVAVRRCTESLCVFLKDFCVFCCLRTAYETHCVWWYSYWAWLKHKETHCILCETKQHKPCTICLLLIFFEHPCILARIYDDPSFQLILHCAMVVPPTFVFDFNAYAWNWGNHKATLLIRTLGSRINTH